MSILKYHNNRIESVEVLRFVAALFVVLVHIPIPGVKFGHFGVDIFFVISGFIIMFTTSNDNQNFLLKRCIRVMPTYYIFTLCVFAVSLLFPAVLNSTKPNFVHLLKSLLFIPFDKNGGGAYPILFLGWTLNYEMYFYTIFSIGMFLNYRNRGLLCCVFLTSIYLYFMHKQELPFSYYGSTLVFEFMLGILLFEILVTLNFKNILAISSLQIAFWFSATNIKSERAFYFGYPAFLVCWFFIILTRKAKFPRLLVALGGASYSLYLSHPYVIQIFVNITHSFSRGALEALVATIVGLIASNVVALVIYFKVEIPLTRFLRKKLL